MTEAMREELEKQLYEHKRGAGFDAPDDAEWCVSLTAKHWRALETALSLPQDKGEEGLVHAQSSSASAVDRPSATISDASIEQAFCRYSRDKIRFKGPAKYEEVAFKSGYRAAMSALMAAQAVHGEQNDQARMNPKSVSGDPK